MGDDLTPGVAARVYDAAWLLARQWQLGELSGDDGGTPISVRHTGATSYCTRYKDPVRTRQLVPGDGPLEAFVEPAGQPLTLLRRTDLGRALVRQLRAASLNDRLPALLKAFPLTGGLAADRIPDGGAALEAFESSLRADPPSLPTVADLMVDADLIRACVEWLQDCASVLGEPAAGAWQERRLGYTFSVAAPSPTSGVELVADDHGGGALDWWSFDARPIGPEPAAQSLGYDVTTFPTRASFRGMPVPRWWQEEDAVIDLGGVEANAADLARMAMLQFALVFGNDHFVLPVELPVGSVFRTSHLLVTDTFGITVALDPAGYAGPGGRRGEGAQRWTMFTPTLRDGSGVADLYFLPATAMHQLTSRPLEDVHLLRDEMANLAWAVESVVEGAAGPVQRAERTLPEQPEPPSTGPLHYRLGTTVPPHWFPLAPVRTTTGDVPELSLQQMANSPEVPAGQLLHIGLALDDDRLPREGRRVLREQVLTRWQDGSTQRWTRRRATIGRGEGSSGLAFDIVTPEG